MDKPTIPAGPNATPQPEGSGSEQDFGATGVFGVVKPAEPAKKPEPGWGIAPPGPAYKAPEVPKPVPPVQPGFPAEPVVNRVVFGGGAAASSPDLLERMRMASAEKSPTPPSPTPPAPVAPVSPAPVEIGRGSGGFTELLRTLEFDRPSQAAPSAALAPAEVPAQRPQPAAASIPAQPVAPATGGFTELMRAMPSMDSDPGGAQIQQAQGPVAGGGLPVSSSPAGNKPGTFTQLFGTLDAAATPPPPEPAADWGPPTPPAPAANKPGTFTQLFGALDSAAPPSPPEPADRAGGSPGPFTRMMSIEQQSAPATLPFAAAPSYYEERKPAPGGPDYGATPQTARPAEPSRDPFAPAPLTEPPLQSAPPSGGVGITRLIRMLDEPGTVPPPITAASVAAPHSAEPGIWTQSTASMSEPEQPSSSPAKAQTWTPPPPPPLVAPASTPPAANNSAPPPPAGPSEFTRILDASRMRELAMKGGQTPVAPGPPAPSPAPQSFALPASAPSIPSYQPPASSPVGATPPYGGYPPPQAPQPPAYPMNYPPAAGGMHAPAVNMPPAPAMYAPAPPPMPAPSAPPAPFPPAQPAGGKLQQMLPMLLIVVGVLFLILIVLFVFVLLRH